MISWKIYSDDGWSKLTFYIFKTFSNLVFHEFRFQTFSEGLRYYEPNYDLIIS